MATRWLPDIKEFFESYCRVLTDCGNLENVDDRADFFARRIEDYEQTVRVLAARLQETIFASAFGAVFKLILPDIFSREVPGEMRKLLFNS